jgi:hypothetical protein
MKDLESVRARLPPLFQYPHFTALSLWDAKTASKGVI